MAERSFTQILVERPAPSVARIVMNRPEKRNAQGVTMTYELDDAFKMLCQDDGVSVIILAGAGDHFSAGHDLSFSDRSMPDPGEVRSLWGEYGARGWEGMYSREHELYLDITERWRNAPKPTIAEIQGVCVAGGNMLAWACDLIVAADDARFRDTTIDMAIPGAEFFAHPFELGVRKAKEWLFTGDWLTAAEAERRGMVNHVVPRAELTSATLELAGRIAAKDRFALKLAKEAMNLCQDAMGRRQGMSSAFLLHQVGHMQNMLVHGFPIAYDKLHPSVREMVERHIKARAAAKTDAAE